MAVNTVLDRPDPLDSLRIRFASGAVDNLIHLAEEYGPISHSALRILLLHFVRTKEPVLAERCYSALPTLLENQVLINHLREELGANNDASDDWRSESNLRRGLRGQEPFARLTTYYYLGKTSRLRGDTESATSFWNSLLDDLNAILDEPKQGVKLPVGKVAEILLDEDIHINPKLKRKSAMTLERLTDRGLKDASMIIGSIRQNTSARSAFYHAQCITPTILEPLLQVMNVASKTKDELAFAMTHSKLSQAIDEIQSLEAGSFSFSIYINIGVRLAQMGQMEMAHDIATMLQDLPDSRTPPIVRMSLPYLFYLTGDLQTARDLAKEADKRLEATSHDIYSLRPVIGDTTHSIFIYGLELLGNTWAGLSASIGSGKFTSDISEREAFINASNCFTNCGNVIVNLNCWENFLLQAAHFIDFQEKQITSGFVLDPRPSTDSVEKVILDVGLPPLNPAYKTHIQLMMGLAHLYGRTKDHKRFANFFARCEALLEDGYLTPQVLESILSSYAVGTCKPIDYFRFDSTLNGAPTIPDRFAHAGPWLFA